MCCIDCRNQKRELNPTKIFYVQGNQENRQRCATLADIFPDSEKGGLMTLNAYYSIICFKKIREVLLLLLKNDFSSL